MHPTGSRTTLRFNAQWGSSDVESQQRGKRRLRQFATAILASVLLLPTLLVAQGPISPASYGYQRGPVSGGPHSHMYGPGCPPSGPAALSPNTVHELLPADRFSHGDEPFLAAFASAFKHSYLRLEYLNWGIDDPGRKNVGAPRADGNERGLFTALDPITQTNVGLGELSTLYHISQTHNNGLRGVFGLPTRVGLFEAGVSVLEQSSASEVDVPFVDRATLSTIIPVVTLLENGVPSNTKMILFNQGINTQVESEFFTTELNWIMNPLTPNQPLEIRPLFGFQYIRFWDTLDISGSNFDQGALPNDPTDDITLNHRINSQAKNNVFAPQVGFRAEFQHEFFSVGVTPKFLMGFNRHRDEVFSEQLFTVDEARMAQHEEASEFAPALDLAVHGKIHLHEHLSLFVSYQLFYMSNISRATENLVFDSIGTDPNIRLNPSQQGTFVDGVTVGGEVRF